MTIDPSDAIAKQFVETRDLAATAMYMCPIWIGDEANLLLNLHVDMRRRSMWGHSPRPGLLIVGWMN